MHKNTARKTFLDHHIEDDRLSHTDTEDRMDALEVSFSELKGSMGSKVSWAWFITTMIAVMGLQVALFVYIAGEIGQLRQDQQATKNTVYEINGKLEPFDFILNKTK